MAAKGRVEQRQLKGMLLSSSEKYYGLRQQKGLWHTHTHTHRHTHTHTLGLGLCLGMEGRRVGGGDLRADCAGAIGRWESGRGAAIPGGVAAQRARSGG